MAIKNISNYETTLVFLLMLLPVVLCTVPAALTLERRFPTYNGVELGKVRGRDLARHRKKLAESSGNAAAGAVDFAVDGTFNQFSTGLYYAKIRLGSPPQQFYVVIDTGSDVMWVSCTSCSGCPTTSGLNIKLNTFDPSSSSTASSISCSDRRCGLKSSFSDSNCSNQTNQCSFDLRYNEGSGSAGYYVEDVMHLERVVGNSVVSITKAPVLFGCSTSLSGILAKPASAVDGIFGLSQHRVSVVSQLFSQESTPNAFSHCLQGGDSGGGILVFGYVVEPNLVYTPLLPFESHYKVHMRSIAVDGQNFPINPLVFSLSDNQETVIDSGTTLAYLPKKVYDPFVNAITQAVLQSVRPVLSEGFQCYVMSSSVSSTFPSVILNFSGGASMILKPEDYLLKPKSAHGTTTRCIGFQKANAPDSTLLGELVLKDKIVVYDLAGQRIGWADHDCSLAVNVSTNSSSGMSEFVSARHIRGSSSQHDASIELIPICIILFISNMILFYSFPTL